MPDLPFTWDTRKAKQNLEKDHVSFDEASTVFYDEQALQIEDPDEVSGEDRFVMIGKCPLAAAGCLPLRARCRERDPAHLRPAGGEGRAESVLGEAKQMRKKYDFSQARKNPYAGKLKKQITLRIDQPTIQFFRESSESSGIPYQTLINLYLRDCAQQGRKLSIEWRASSQGA